MSLSETNDPNKVLMTIRFEGLTIVQVAAIHHAVENAKTDTCGCGERVSIPGKPEGFIAVSKSELKGEGGRYAVLLRVKTQLVGFIHPLLPENDRRYATIYPSRKGLGAIFDAAGILPEDDIVKDMPEVRIITA